MRLVHTSDWHLGRRFYGAGLEEAHRSFVDFLVDLVGAEAVDAVLIAGDVYDRAVPRQDAVELFDEALTRLRQAGAQVVVSSGNHDSAVRLGFAGRLLSAGGVHLRTDVRQVAEPVLLGSGTDRVAVYGIPYLDPHAAAGVLGVEGRSQQAVVSAALALARRDLQDRGVPGVVLAHTFVTGADGSDSELSIAVGGVDLVGADAFDGFAYAALGHLHRPQQVRPGVVYSGSPVALSFSEAQETQRVVLLDIDDGVAHERSVPVPVHRRATRVRGPLQQVLTDPALAQAEAHWIEATLTDAVRPPRAMEQVRSRFPHALRLLFDSPPAVSTTSYATRTEGKSALDVCCEFLTHVRPGAPVTGAERGLLTGALDGVRSGIAGDVYEPERLAFDPPRDEPGRAGAA